MGALYLEKGKSKCEDGIISLLEACMMVDRNNIILLLVVE